MVNMHIINIWCWENRGTMDKHESHTNPFGSISQSDKSFLEMKQWCKNMFLGRVERSLSSCLHFIFCTNSHNIFDKSTPPCVKPCNSIRVQPCDSCFSCLRCGGTSPSCDDEDFAPSHSWTPYIHPAGTASVFSFHMIEVTPHSCYNFSAAHLLWKPQSHVF